MNKTIIAVFKCLAICAILMVFISLATNIFVVFTTYSKLDSVCKIMQSEISRNNCLLDVSMYGDNGFIKQLDNICSQTKGSNGTDQMFTLKEIAVVDGDKPYYYVQDGNLDTKDGTSPADDETAGKYGTVKVLKVTFTTNITGVMLTGNGANVQQQNIGNGDFTLEYYAPCLRYIK